MNILLKLMSTNHRLASFLEDADLMNETLKKLMSSFEFQNALMKKDQIVAVFLDSVSFDAA